MVRYPIVISIATQRQRFTQDALSIHDYQ